MQPRHRHRRAARHLRGRRRQPPVVRRAVDGAPRARRPRPHPRPRQRAPRRRRWPARHGFDDVQPRPHLRRRRRDRSTTGGARSTRCSPSTRPTSRPTRLTVEPGTPLADDPARHPDDDDQADKYLARRRDAFGAAGLGVVRDLELGPARPRVPPQPPLLVAGRLPRVRLRRPLAPRRAAVVERAHARALHRRRRRRASRPRPPARSSTPTPARSRRCSSRCAPAPACRSTPSTATSSRGLVDGRRGDRCGADARGPPARQRGGAPAQA